MVTVVLSLPLIIGVGLATDAAGIANTQASLQEAIDSAVLSVASEGKDISQSRAQEIALRFLSGNSNMNFTTVNLDRDGTRVTLEAQSRAKMAFGGLLGYEDWPVKATASADIAYVGYEVGLVLDTTGSMEGGKLASMKDAVNGLIDSMSTTVTDKDRLKFALVPFSSFVNVGAGHAPKIDLLGRAIDGTGASWLDIWGKSPIPQSEFPPGLSRFEVYKNVLQTWGGCVESRPITSGIDYAATDAPPDASKPETLFVPSFAIDEEDSGYDNSYFTSNVKTLDSSLRGLSLKMKKYGVPIDNNGKVFPHGKKGNTNKNSITTWIPTKVKAKGTAMGGAYKIGPSFGCVAKPIAPLTNDYASLKAQVAALEAKGSTNIMEGVAWGLRVLSPGEPFTEGADSKDAGVKKIMVVLTDGSNTLGNNETALGSTYSSFGYLKEGRLGITGGGETATTKKMNERTLAACAAAKADGVEIFTIRLEEPNVATGTMLKECASSSANYFDVPSRSQLEQVFSKIRNHMMLLRMSS